MVTDLLCKKFDYLAGIGRYCRQRADLTGVLVLRVIKNELYTMANLEENIMRQKRINTFPSPKNRGWIRRTLYEQIHLFRCYVIFVRSCFHVKCPRSICRRSESKLILDFKVL
jgi:hypothetical protein